MRRWFLDVALAYLGAVVGVVLAVVLGAAIAGAIDRRWVDADDLFLWLPYAVIGGAGIGVTAAAAARRHPYPVAAGVLCVVLGGLAAAVSYGHKDLGPLILVAPAVAIVSTRALAEPRATGGAADAPTAA